MADMRTRNCLKQHEFFRLCKEIESLDSVAMLANRHLAAPIISKKIGFEVTAANIEAAMKTTGVKPPFPHEPELLQKPFKVASKHNGKKPVVSNATRSLARALLSLCTELGHRPKNLEQIAQIAEYDVVEGP